jgi:hypothetical protein
MALDLLDPLDLIQPFCSGRAKPRCGAVLPVNFPNFYRQHFSGFHTFMAKIMLKMSSTSFGDYLISRAHYINFGQIGRKPRLTGLP